MAWGKCVAGLTDKTVNFCEGEKVYVLLGDGSVVGPVLLDSVKDEVSAVVRVEGTEMTANVSPSVMIAVDKGCTADKESTLCVGHVVWDKQTKTTFKIVGRFEDDYVAAALCTNEDCSEYAVEPMVEEPIIVQFQLSELLLKE